MENENLFSSNEKEKDFDIKSLFKEYDNDFSLITKEELELY